MKQAVDRGKGLHCIQLRLTFAPLVLLAVVVTADAASISVADGDSFRMNGQRYRLQDIDAPELHQTCRDSRGHEWPCGRRARAELRKILGNGAIDCKPVTTDRFGRIVASCNVGGRDVGEMMVRNGWAVAYRSRRSSGRYVGAENDARTAQRGIWSGSFEGPRDWRRERSRQNEDGGILSQEAQAWWRQKTQALSNWLRTIWPKP